jgi:hypothetical protein
VEAFEKSLAVLGFYLLGLFGVIFYPPFDA